MSDPYMFMAGIASDTCEVVVPLVSPLASVLNLEDETLQRKSPPLGRRYVLVCSCDHLLCISTCDREYVFVWNPSINDLHLLPEIDRGSHSVFFGMGREPVSRTFKMVALNGFSNSVSILTLGTNEWKPLDDIRFDFKFHPWCRGRGTSVSGTINYLFWAEADLYGIPNGLSYFIVSVDLLKEHCQDLYLPTFKKDEYNTMDVILDALMGCLCVVVRTRNRDIQVWCMKEFGKPASWSQLFTIPSNIYLPDPNIHLPLGMPMVHMLYMLEEHGLILMGFTYKLFVYHLNLNSVSVLKTFDLDCVFRVVYKETWISFSPSGIASPTTTTTTSEDEANSKGVYLLAMATLLSERDIPGDYSVAISRLHAVLKLKQCSLSIKVAAFEALVGFCLASRKDDKASQLADSCIGLVMKNEETQTPAGFEALVIRARAIKGLVELVKGNVESATDYFDSSLEYRYGNPKSILRDKPLWKWEGTAAFSYALFLHKTKEFVRASKVYCNVIKSPEHKKDYSYLGANYEDLKIGAICAFAQLQAHQTINDGDVEEEELEGEVLDRDEIPFIDALIKAENIYGKTHPKVGVVLTAYALMLRHYAPYMKTNGHLRNFLKYCQRSTHILKVPETESEGTTLQVDRSDIAALARGVYAEALCVQENTKEEGEKMKNLAESIWENCRMSLADALRNTECVLDTRISRFF